jgi:hypothetical protein
MNIGKMLRDKVGSLDYETILVFVSNCDKDLAKEMIKEKKKSLAFDWIYMGILPFHLVFAILIFSTIVHFLTKPNHIPFHRSLTFACYFCGTFYFLVILAFSLFIWQHFFIIAVLTVPIYSLVLFNRAIAQLYSTTFWKANVINSTAIIVSGIGLAIIAFMTIWIIEIFRRFSAM